MDIKEKNQEIAETYSIDFQLCQLMEECGELIQAANKYRRHKEKGNIKYALINPLETAIKEEIADVQVVIEQICHLLNIQEGELANIRENKIKRTYRRMNHGIH